jgi:uncharacterized Zn-binding protein involved in type VI secretion
MAGISRSGVDVAGGIILPSLQSTVFANGALVVVVGTPVTGHGLPPHTAPVMESGSGTVFAGGIAVCRAGDVATCGDAASGSDDVTAG